MQRSSEEMRKQRDPSAGARARVAARREGKEMAHLRDSG